MAAEHHQRGGAARNPPRDTPETAWPARAGLVDESRLSFSELADLVDHPTAEQVRDWQAGGPRDWARESQELRGGLLGCVRGVLLRTSRIPWSERRPGCGESALWVIQIDIDGARYTERDYAIIADAGWVKDAKYQSLRQEMQPMAYLAVTQNPRPAAFAQLVIRSRVPAPQMIPSLKKAFEAAGPAIVPTFQDYQAMVDGSLMRDQLVALLSSFFGLLVVLLATLGLYGVIAFAVARRTGEIGIRMALGADRIAILRLVLGEALALVAIGLAAGTALALALSQTVRSLVYGLEPGDPLTLLMAALLLSLVALGAGLVPARHAAKLDPMVALRYE